uniref:FHA domain-containing protein n=1 Tax=Romanomermis culicivorax TaxID=13658 RepID=A0A915IRQ7_ROMCU
MIIRAKNSNYDRNLEQDFVKFGRNPEHVDIVLHSSAYANMISREHAEIKRSKLPDGTVIYHLIDRSLNGTYVNDFRVAGQRLLQVGDVIQFGHINGAAIHPGECAPQPDAEFTYVSLALHEKVALISGEMRENFEKVPRHSSALGAKMASFFAASSAGRFSNAAAAASKWTNNPYALAASGAAAAQNAYLAAAAASFNPAAAAAYHLQSALTAGQSAAAARQSPFTQDANAAVGGNWLAGVAQPASIGVLGGSYAAAAAAAQQRLRNLGPECTASTSAAMANFSFQQTSSVTPNESNFGNEQQQQRQASRDLRMSISAHSVSNFNEQQGYQNEPKSSCDIDYRSPNNQSLTTDARFSGNRYTDSIVRASDLRSFYEEQRLYPSKIEKQSALFADQNFNQNQTERTISGVYGLNDSPDSVPISRNTVVMEAPVRTLADTSLQTQRQQSQEVCPSPQKVPIAFNESNNAASSTILQLPDTTNQFGAAGVVQASLTCIETAVKSLHDTSTSLSKMECDSSVPSPPASDAKKTNETEIFEPINDDEAQGPDMKTCQESSSSSRSRTTSPEKLEEKRQETPVKSPQSFKKASEKISKAFGIHRKRKSNEVARLLDELSDSSFMFEMRKKEAQLRRRLGQVEVQKNGSKKNRKRQHSVSDDDKNDKGDNGSNRSTENSEYETTDRDAKVEESDSENEILSRLSGSFHKSLPRRSKRNIATVSAPISDISALSAVVKRNLRSSPKGPLPSKASRESPRSKTKIFPAASCLFLRSPMTSSSSSNSDQSESDDDSNSSARYQKSAKPKSTCRSLRSTKPNMTNKRIDKNNSSNRSKSSSKKKAMTTEHRRKRPVKSVAICLEDVSVVTADKKDEILPRDLFWSYHDPTVSCAADQSCLKPTDSEVQWVQCDKCSGWYHVDCVDCDYDAIKGSDAEYNCDKCK